MYIHILRWRREGQEVSRSVPRSPANNEDKKGYIYIHIHTYIYVYVHLSLSLYKYIYLSLSIGTHIYVSTCIGLATEGQKVSRSVPRSPANNEDAKGYIYTHLHIYIYMYISFSLSLYIYIYTYIYTCTHKYIHIYIHTHMYIHISRWRRGGRGASRAVVGCKIPRKENSPMFRSFSRPSVPVSPD